MKKMIFALLLGLGIAQVSPVVAADAASVVAKESKFAAAWKNHKKQIIVGASALSVLAVAGIAAGVTTACWKYDKPTGAQANIEAAAQFVLSYVNPKGYSTKAKKAGIIALEVVVGVAAIYGLAELGYQICKKDSHLGAYLYNLAKGKKAAK